MQKKYSLRILIWILILIGFGCNKYCRAQGTQNDSYLEFERLIQNTQKTGAIEFGDELFNGLLLKYSKDSSLQNFQERLEAAHNLSQLMIQNLKSRQKNVFMGMMDNAMSPASPPVENHRKEIVSCPSAEQLYWTHLIMFSHEIEFQNIESIESEFLWKYYDLKMQCWIKEINTLVSQILIADSTFSDLHRYGIVLPLLCFSDDDPYWRNLDGLFAVMRPADLDVLSDFCLLRVERPKIATTIAKYKAVSMNQSFSLVDWSLAASDKCIKEHRPDIAWKLLCTVIESLNDKNEIMELRLKIARNFSECSDYTRSEKEYQQILKDFPESPLYGEAASHYFTCLAKQSKTEKILQEIDSALEMPQCQSCAPQLMYLKWWSLCKNNRSDEATTVGKRLIQDYESNPCIAPVLLSCATDFLASQDYDRSQELLQQLVENFPQTASAKQAQKILEKIRVPNGCQTNEEDH